MKYGVLAVSKGVDNKINIGDYIQALASAQYLPQIDKYIERETELKTYSGEEVSMIMNGWYMNYPQNWPPSSLINPLFVSLHINKCGLPDFLNSTSIAYLKNHEPIGCRDQNTVKLLQEKNINAYFSGCMTLTLGFKYKSNTRNNKVYIVEPYTCQAGLWNKHKWISLKTFIYMLTHIKDIKTISSKKKENGLKHYFYNAYFLKAYSKVFDYKMLIEAEYINQYNYDIQKQYPTQNDKMRYAEELIKKYAQASCVITSRIHCALPCTGLETPVIFVDLKNDNEYSTDRFGGLIDLFNTISWDGLKLTGNLTKQKINQTNFPKVKPNWKPIAQKLIKDCTDFIESTKKRQ